MLGGQASYQSADGRRESHKRRRLSERRRIFGRLGFTGGPGDSSLLMADTEDRLRFRRQPAASPAADRPLYYNKTLAASTTSKRLNERTGQPPADHQAAPGSKISMKIQFHITVAPDNEPLILDPHAPGASSFATASLFANTQDPREQSANGELNDCAAGPTRPSSGQDKDSGSAFSRQRASISSIGEQINEKLSRQSTLSTRRRQQLLAMHNQSALDNINNPSDHQKRQAADLFSNGRIRSDSATNATESSSSMAPLLGRAGQPALGRDSGARSSTISGGMQDEATMRFLAQHETVRPRTVSPSVSTLANYQTSGSLSSTASGRNNSSASQHQQREHIYFKRDGQRFGHEFTLKLAVDKSYRCLLKVRPLIPLQAISIQGHHVAFVDCSTNPGAQLSSSAPASTGSLNSSLQSINTGSIQGTNQRLIEAQTGASLGSRARAGHLMYQQHSASISSSNSTTSSSCGHTGQLVSNRTNHTGASRYPNNQSNRWTQAQTTLAISLAERRLSSALNSTTPSPLIDNQLAACPGELGPHQTCSASSRQVQQFLLKQQQHNQMMRHFAASHCSPSGSHLGGQSFYMFDWSAGRFEVNKNKARTQLQTVLKFKNGQILSLPLQVKFYQPESRQHLNWGSQLHFIDYDCQIDTMGQIQLEKIQYY